MKRALVLALQVALLLVWIEGAASWLVAATEGWSRARRPLAEDLHVQWDEEIGWVARPGVRLPHLYGRDVGLSTNARGFRGVRETAKPVPPERRRIVCSGDSFTLGYGVADAEAWCARLESLLPGVETVNLGQGGYGLDQAWLWFRRQAPELDHQVHLFAFIGEDFLRMEVDRFAGHAKPVLRIGAGGELQLTNVPVPADPSIVPSLVRSIQGLRQLRVVQLYEAFSGGPLDLESRPSPEQDTAAIALRVLEDLASTARETGSALVAVWLPMQGDLPAGPGDVVREGLRIELERRGITMLDLLADFRALPAREAKALFLQPGEIDFPAAEGHYTAEGNAFVAERLAARLRALPATAARLGLSAPR